MLLCYVIVCWPAGPARSGQVWLVNNVLCLLMFVPGEPGLAGVFTVDTGDCYLTFQEKNLQNYILNKQVEAEHMETCQDNSHKHYRENIWKLNKTFIIIKTLVKVSTFR